MTGSYACKCKSDDMVRLLLMSLPIAWFFLIAGGYMMFIWAIKRHRNYKKEFGKAYPKRNVIIPFLF